MTTQRSVPDILSEEFAADPYSAYRVLREDFPLLYHEATGSYIVSRYEDVERAFRESVFTSRNYEWQLEPVHGGPTIMQMTGREHSVRRALVAPAFRGKELQERFVPMIERNARELIDGFRDTGYVDLARDFAAYFPVNVIADMLDLDKKDHPKFHRLYTAVVRFFANISGDPEVVAEGERARDEFAEYMLPIIARRRENPGTDLVSSLCTAEVDGTRMSDHDIKSFCSLLLAAGGETTDKAISHIVKNLLEHPDQLAAVRANRELITPAFAETLRYTPMVQMIIRQPEADVTLSGGTVPAGSTVICVIGAANRDPERYTDPESFNIFRDDLNTNTAFSAAADHLAFSLGRHFCVGTLLAKAEVEVAVDQLLDAMHHIRLEEGDEPTEEGMFTRGYKSLRLRFTPARSPAASEAQSSRGSSTAQRISGDFRKA